MVSVFPVLTVQGMVSEYLTLTVQGIFVSPLAFDLRLMAKFKFQSKYLLSNSCQRDRSMIHHVDKYMKQLFMLVNMVQLSSLAKERMKRYEVKHDLISMWLLLISPHHLACEIGAVNHLFKLKVHSRDVFWWKICKVPWPWRKDSSVQTVSCH